MDKILRVNMSAKEVQFEAVPDKYERWGGRGLTSSIILDEVDPQGHPLSDRNKVIFAPGILSGTPAPCMGKLSIGSKSPLTGTIKESNVGGTAGTKFPRLGIKALIIEGEQRNNDWYILYIDKDSAKLESAKDIYGLGNYDTAARLQERYGKRVSILSIGQAGEMKLSASSIASTDLKSYPSRHAGRGGLGAALSAKGIKAIVLNDERTKKFVPLVDRDRFKKLSLQLSKQLVETKKGLTKYGTAQMIDTTNSLGGLPTRNFRQGAFEGAEKINGQALYDNIKARGGTISLPCIPSCVIRCANSYPDKDGNYLTSSLEYETIAMLGANCGIDDLDVIAILDKLCDDYGLDVIDTGGAIGVAMEAGLLKFGDGEAAINLLKEVGAKTPLGRIIGSGANLTGRILGVKRVAQVKGQGMSAYDPRTFKGFGATYISSTMGADHTAGPAIPGRGGLHPSKKSEVHEPEDKAELSLDLQIMVAAVDSTGFCFFVGPQPPMMKMIAEMLKARYGWDLTAEDIVEMGREILRRERRFNELAGFTKADNRLPSFFLEEPLPPFNRVFDVSYEEMDDQQRRLDY